MDAFWLAFAITTGILSPIILVIILSVIVPLVQVIPSVVAVWRDKQRKLPPFDDVMVNRNPATRVVTVKFYKDDVIVWQGNVSQNEVE